MTFIVRIKKPAHNFPQLFDIVEDAGHASVGAAGELILRPSRGSNEVTAVYAAGEWTTATKDDSTEAVLEEGRTIKLSSSGVVKAAE
ncbi:hypothetical protein RN2511_035970 [Rhodococcus sp. NKCM2511]|uniref:hypothetical protein n=1 Tax=Rhodococcus sp. NKCM2511 TaxID=2766011 RepID=UPI00190FEE79|nr:hypothetical protein [Rhodococcus sp. NKCM2511]GHP18861.1 hypothetical protein RN2511_035970 [Rhodococcus sp. NKCM2511]